MCRIIFPLQREESASELAWLHNLLGRNNDNELVSADVDHQEPVAILSWSNPASQLHQEGPSRHDWDQSLSRAAAAAAAINAAGRGRGQSAPVIVWGGGRGGVLMPGACVIRRVMW